jgi:hypothetical protein
LKIYASTAGQIKAVPATDEGAEAEQPVVEQDPMAPLILQVI